MFMKMIPFKLGYVSLLLVSIVVSMLLMAVGVEADESGKGCKCGQVFDSGDVGVRVTGGTVMSETSHPFLVAILVNNVFNCGGSLISPTFVLTAGHCVTTSVATISRYSVALGVHNRVKWSEIHGKIHPVLKIIRHEDYTKTEFGVLLHDIALMKIKPIRFNDLLKPICLPQKINWEKHKVARLAGWGTKSVALSYGTMYPRQTLLTVLTEEQFLRSPLHDIFEKNYVPSLDKLMVFAYKAYSDACNGDSGGPLYVIESSAVYQIGIVSMGIDCGNNRQVPGVYTSVHHYLDWISKHVIDLCYPS